MLLFHYGSKQQIGGRGPRVSELLLNILKRGSITYYSISFDQHKNFYDFFSSDPVETFLNSLYQVFRPNKECKFQGYSEIVNQQKGETFLGDKTVWLTNVHHSKYLNNFVRGELNDEISKSVIVNGQTGSSWHFKRFDRLNVIVVPVSDAKKTDNKLMVYCFLCIISKLDVFLLFF